MRLKNLKHTFIHISNENYRRIFTNKASDELKRRCKQRCADTKQSFFGTIDKFYISQIIIPFSSHVTGNITECRQVGFAGIGVEHLTMQQLCTGAARRKFFIGFTHVAAARGGKGDDGLTF